MGFLDRFRGKAQITSAIELRDALIDAAANKDRPRFTALCNTHTAAIRESFKDWIKVPDDKRNDTAAMQRYAEAMWLLASVFENAGDGTLKAILANPKDNPATAWEEDFKQAEHRRSQRHSCRPVSASDPRSVGDRPLSRGRRARGNGRHAPCADALPTSGR
jgi:hypothetical protein